jgi:hypothetical protein
LLILCLLSTAMNLTAFFRFWLFHCCVTDYIKLYQKDVYYNKHVNAPFR